MSIPEGYTCTTRINGVKQTRGKTAGIETNYAYKAKDPLGNDCILMHCNPGQYVIIDNEETLTRLRKYSEKQITWFIMSTGYAGTHVRLNDVLTCITMHQFIMNYYGHGKGKDSIDHINMNKLDNRIQNLRITTQSIQNMNREKVSRQNNAKELPAALNGIVFPKFVVYYSEKVNHTVREYFTVEGHPIQKLKDFGVVNNATAQLTSRRWATTKSGSVSIIDKFNQAVQFVQELDKLLLDPDYTICITAIKKHKSVAVPEPIAEPEPEPEPTSELESKPRPKKIERSDLKQWKTRQIYEAFQDKEEGLYKKYCEDNNEALPDWDEFADKIRLQQSYETAEPIIKQFVESLRAGRHGKLVEKYNKVHNNPDREDRQQWPSATILKVYKDGTMDLFKKWLNEQDGTDPDERWTKLIEKLDAADTDKKRQEIISKFLTARRVRKYREGIKAKAKAGMGP